MADPTVNPPPSPDSGLPELGSLRRLARRLIFDPGAADDLVQEAWLVALRRGIGGSERPRFLHGVLRRLASQRWREEDRRRQREAKVAHEREPVPATDELSARLEATRRVVEAVEGLAEPYRTAVVLRFFDDLPPREIAKRLDVPVNTVQTHVQRGLAQLRKRLARTRGESDRSLSALLPLAGPISPLALLFATGSSSSSKWIGSLMMSSKTKTWVALAAALMVIATTVRVLQGGTEVEPLREEGVSALAPLEPRPDAVAAPEEALELAAPETTESAAAPARREELPAPRGDWVLAGRVLGRGEGLPNCRVRLRQWQGHSPDGEPWREHDLSTDANGRFEWGGDTPDHAVFVEVLPTRAGWLSYPLETRIRRGATPPDLTLRILPQDASLVGRVLDEAGAPIAGASVEATYSSATTKEDGSYRLSTSSELDQLFAGVYADGFATGNLNALLDEPGEHPQGDLVLRRELRVRGRVVDTSGRAIEGARVYTQSWRPPAGISDTSGAFSVGRLDPERPLRTLIVTATGFGRTLHRLDEAAWAGEPTEIVLPPGIEVRGLVLGPDGQPVEGAQVCLDNPPQTLPNVTTWTDRDGRFRFVDEPEGTRALWVVHEAHVPFETQVELLADVALEVKLSGGHSLSGVVLDENGQPMPMAWVCPSRNDHSMKPVGNPVYTDDEGRFRLDALPNTSLHLVCMKDGYTRLEFQPGGVDQSDLIIEMRRAGGLAGRVVDGRTGEPIRAFRIRLLQPELAADEVALDSYDISWLRPGYDFADDEGLWSSGSEEFEPGRVIAIEASAEGYAPATLARAVVRGEPDPDENVLALLPGVTLRGQVLERSSGAPIADALVRRFTAREGRQAARFAPEDGVRTRTDENGFFELRDLPLEEMSLSVEAEGLAITIDGPFDPAATGEDDRLIRLDEGLRLRGRLEDGDGRPLGDEQIAIYTTSGELNGQFETCSTDANGLFEVRGLRTGRHQVSWRLQGDAVVVNALTGFVELDEDAPRTGELDLVLRPGGRGTLSGLLQLDDGRAYEGRAVVFLWHEHAPPTSTGMPPETSTMRGALASEGRFEVPFLQAGTWKVSIKGGRATGSEWVGLATAEIGKIGTTDVVVTMKPH